MSKLSHSNTDTVIELDIERAIEDRNEDLIFDRDFRVHAGSIGEKIIAALKRRGGTSFRYPEIRALARMLVTKQTAKSLSEETLSD